MKEITNTDKKSITVAMANKFHMEPKNFEQVLKSTVVPQNITNEQFAAFLLVANEYNLNPITKEIYAFPNRGTIQPIVGVDGWSRIINEHPQFNGCEFQDRFNNDRLIAITCKIYRKDRDHPVEVTEYLDECKGTSEPWKKWPARMLRHKALIQCARYAFGFSGIVDPDEAERICEAKDITPEQPKPKTSDATAAVLKHAGDNGDDEIMIN